MSLPHGGHLTHGSPVNVSGKWFKVVAYGLDPETELIDYAQAERLAHEHKPKLIIAGASAYSRVIDWKRFRAIADSVGAQLMVDMAHYAGLIAAGVYPTPVGIADFVTSTTHKTLRGPRGGFILDARPSTRRRSTRAVFPGPAGRAADARDRRQGRGVRRGAARATSRSTRSACSRTRACSPRCCRTAACASCPAAPTATCSCVDLRAKRITGKDAEAALAARAHHRQQERDPERSGEAVRDVGHPHRQPGDHDARLRRDRMRGARPPDRRRARGASRRRGRHACARGRRGADAAFPGLLADDARRRAPHEVPVLRQRRHPGDRLARVGAGRFDPPPPPLPRLPEALHHLRDGRAAPAAGREDQRRPLGLRRRQDPRRLPARAAQAAGADRLRRRGDQPHRRSRCCRWASARSRRGRSARW